MDEQNVSRRGFIKSAGIGLGATALVGTAAESAAQKPAPAV